MGHTLQKSAIAAVLAATLLNAGCADMAVEGAGTTTSLTATAEGEAAQKPRQPDQSANMLKLASEIEARGSVETAIPIYEKAAAAADANAAAHTRLADAYARAERFAESEASYRTALAKQTDYGPAMLGLGGVLIRSGKREEGLSTLAKAAPIVNKAAAYDKLGVAHIVLGQPREALASFEQAHSMAPNDIDIATNLALAAALAGQYEKGADLAKRISATDKLQDYHRRNLILVFGITGNAKDAKLAAGDSVDPASVATLLKQAEGLRKISSPKKRALALGTLNPNAQ